jgi:hypothetical protein
MKSTPFQPSSADFLACDIIQYYNRQGISWAENIDAIENVMLAANDNLFDQLTVKECRDLLSKLSNNIQENTDEPSCSDQVSRVLGNIMPTLEDIIPPTSLVPAKTIVEKMSRQNSMFVSLKFVRCLNALKYAVISGGTIIDHGIEMGSFNQLISIIYALGDSEEATVRSLNQSLNNYTEENSGTLAELFSRFVSGILIPSLKKEISSSIERRDGIQESLTI